jgi:hypothetical protein
MILPGLLLANLLGVANAADVPHLNIDASCRASTQATIGLTQDMNGCLQSENTARDKLAKSWNSFAATDRANCLTLTTTGTTGTYTELLTCLEMKRDARQLPEERNTVGRGSR